MPDVELEVADMFKRLVDGLIFGAGFGIAFVAVWIVAIYFILPNIVVSRFEAPSVESSSDDVVAGVPSISDSSKYLGSSGIYSGDFIHNRKGVLAGGQGVIRGSAYVNEKPLQGLRLRLALNGSVLSQWAVTGPNGEYRVSVPYGEYRIDGYELDRNVANDVLANKISHPEESHSTGRFEVRDGQAGHGLKFRFVDPVVKRLTKRKYSKGDSVILEWEPYPEANSYKVQVFEKADAHTWKSTHLFQWPDKPVAYEPRLDLDEHHIDLKPGLFYAYEVEAMDGGGNLLSKTHRDHSDFDFEIAQ